MNVRIESLSDRDGLAIVDTVEQRRYEIPADLKTGPEPVEDIFITFPVDAAATVTATELRLPQVPSSYIRTAEFDLVEHIKHHSEHRLDDGTYVIDVEAPVKLYISVEGPVTVTADGAFITATAETPTEFVVAARSRHERPAATITTTGEPEDVLEALSYLGSALKTTTPERTWPTLRGHPPALALGDEQDVPAELSKPKTDVCVEVPPTLAHAFIVAPLAYFLGADLVAGDAPRVHAGGMVHSLGTGRGFEMEVERVLKRTFVLECATRAHGLYDAPMFERRELDAILEVDLDQLYDATPGERLTTYLEINYEAVEEYIPQWKLTAHVEPIPEHLDILPFIINDLAVVRTPGNESGDSDASGQLKAIREFTRARADGATRTRSGDAADGSEVVTPERTDSLEQAWVGEHVPVGASKAMVEAFRNRLTRGPLDESIDVVVVCNDTEMADEGIIARDVYGSRDRLPFDVALYEDLPTERLRLVLESDADLLHYVGHIDEGGFRCPNGTLDVGDIDGVGTDAFFLNACSSYGQGEKLIERGAIGGVVTLDEVINSGALRVGKTMTRLLNRGFPLRAALNIARDRSVVGNQYIVIGDGNVDIVHSESMFPNMSEVRECDDGYELSVQTYPVRNAGMGATFRPEIAGNRTHYLVGTSHMEFSVTTDELREFLDLQVVPVRFDGRFTWSDRLEL